MFSTDLILLFFFKFISSQQEPMPCQNDDGNQIQGFCLDSLKKKKNSSVSSQEKQNIFCVVLFFFMNFWNFLELILDLLTFFSVQVTCCSICF